MKKTRSSSVNSAIVVGRADQNMLLPRLLCYMGTVGINELEEMGIAEQYWRYEARDEFQDVAEYLVKDLVLCVAISFDVSINEQYHLLGRCGLVGCSKSNRA